jgi:hypothetical protein
MPYFDSKLFNGEVFQKYVDRVPNLKLNELLKSRAIVSRQDLATAMADQVGGNYITTPLKGLISGSIPLNYDGVTDITSQSTQTFSHSRVVYGRAQAWTEKDFSYDITGGVDFMENVAQQVAEYWDEIDQATLVAVLTGIFSMSDTEGAKFVASHTHDIHTVQNSEGRTGFMDATSLNTAIQKACGDHKNKFSMAIMHSAVTTNLENMKVLAYLKYNDANGMERETGLATLNGRMVIVDDSMPVMEDTSTATFSKTSDTAVTAGKTYYTRTGTSGNYVYTEVTNPVDSSINSYYEKTGAGTPMYVTYLFGDGAIEYTNCGAKVPYEMSRDPKTNGGQDTLYSRQRKCFAPYGISFVGINSISTLSPTDAELATGTNWELVNTGGTNKQYINSKAIPIARIISLG